MDRPKDILSSMYGVCVGDLMDKEKSETGHWIYKEFYDMFMCSCCEKYSIRNDYPYCHWCGAKMEGREFEDG